MKEFGKPRNRVRDRIAQNPHDPALFSTPAAQAFWYSWVVEAPSCWPRVRQGSMTLNRLFEREHRMEAAILPHLTN